MGEIALALVDGVLCEGCWLPFDDLAVPGHPRRCTGCGGTDRLLEVGPPPAEPTRSQRRRRLRRAAAKRFLDQ